MYHAGHVPPPLTSREIERDTVNHLHSRSPADSSSRPGGQFQTNRSSPRDGEQVRSRATGLALPPGRPPCTPNDWASSPPASSSPQASNRSCDLTCWSKRKPPGRAAVTGFSTMPLLPSAEISVAKCSRQRPGKRGDPREGGDPPRTPRGRHGLSAPCHARPGTVPTGCGEREARAPSGLRALRF